MQTFPLHPRLGHLFITLEDRDWLLDEGAPASFGGIASLRIEGKELRLASSHLGLTPAELSELVGHSTAGIVGADILDELDSIIDVPGERRGGLPDLRARAGANRRGEAGEEGR